MALSRIRLPSFTLVLTSGWNSLHGYPTAIKFDPCASYTMLPIVVDHLMKTIDVGDGESVDENLDQYTTQLGHENSGVKKRIDMGTLKKRIFSLKKRLSEMTKSSKRRMF